MFKKFIYFSCILLLLGITSASMAELIAYYPLDGDATDAADNPADGTLVGNPTFEAGKFGDAIRLDGSTQWINCGNPDKLNITGTTITVMCWAKLESDAPNYASMVTKGTGSAAYRLFAWTPAERNIFWGCNGTFIRVGGPTTLADEAWHHVAGTYDGTTQTLYIDGQAVLTGAYTAAITTNTYEVWIGNNSNSTARQWKGLIDEVRIYDHAMTQEEVEASMAPPGVSLPASKPKPENGKDEISIDTVLQWSAPYTDTTHNLYFGTDEALTDVSPVSLANDANFYDPGRLQYGTTYYWRVDEVNDIVVEGDLWSFTTETEGIALEPEDIIDVTASLNSVYPHEQEPNMTCNENGLDANDMHSTALGTMWLGMGDNPGEVWIQYEFDKIYKFHELQVWNYNEPTPSEAFGAKDVNVTYSQDAGTWEALDDIVEFEVATGDDSYTANTFVDMDGAAAKYIRLTFLNSWTEELYTGGISEIRFMVIPTRAAVPSPEDEEDDIEVDAVLNWKAGRDADVHKVYIGSDPNSVRDGIADIIDETSEASYAPVLDLARTYYWKVDEVNEAEEYTTWDGPVWSFSTVDSIVIDDFEVGYGNTSADAVYKTWKDKVELGDSANGSYMGRSSPPYLHTINHSGGHSAPMSYDTLNYNYSEVIAQSADLPIGTSNWSIGSPVTLTIWFRGDPNTTEVGDSELYCKIGGKTAVYGDSLVMLKGSIWNRWDIDLATLGANLSNIPQITIGIRKIGSTGGSGVIYLDDIQLSGLASVEPANPGDANLVAWYKMEDNANDSSPAPKINGTAVGGPTYLDGPFPGYGKAMGFDGVDDYVDLGPAEPFNFTGSFSISSWFNVQEWKTGKIIATGPDGTAGFSVGVLLSGSTNYVRFYHNGIQNSSYGTTYQQMTASCSTPADEWLHVACVYDADNGTVAVYFNGIQQQKFSVASGTLTPSTSHASLGAIANADNTGFESFFNGYIDDVRVYNKALTEDEILFLIDPTP